MTSNLLISIGIGFILAGIAWKFGLLGWFGNLPGDIRYQGDNVSIFIPFTSMILISIVFSVIMGFLKN